MPDSQEPKQVNNNDLRNAQLGGGLINAENVNAGRIGGDIWNIFFGQQTTPVGNPARPKNERILLAAVKEEVTARLRQSLHNAVLINLGKESQPQQVKRPWDTEIKIGLKPPKPLPDTTTILEVFDSPEIAGKLLILGAPGSGKTTTQLELAQELVKRAEEQSDYPVPVLFNLSSWKDNRQSIIDWLVAELKSKYGVSIKLGQEWIDNQQLLPLLDGLDEIEPQRQESCVYAINQFLAGETRPLYLVICSRSEEYSNYNSQLQLNSAIYLEPLNNNQIRDYLTSINSIKLWSTISNDLDLLKLVKTPLLLSITVLTSQEISVEKWQCLGSTADRIQYLLDTYIGRMLTRDISIRVYANNKTINRRKTRMWLVWLAQKMQTESKTEFLIEEMQPNLLNGNKKIIYNLIVWSTIGALFYGLMTGLIVSLIIGLAEEISFLPIDPLPLIFGMIIGVLMGFINGLIFGLINGLIGEIIENKIQEVATSIIFLKKYSKTIIKWLFLGLIIGIINGLLFTPLYELINQLFNGVFYGLIYGFINGLIGDNIKPVEKIKFSKENFILKFVIGFNFGIQGWFHHWYNTFFQAISVSLIFGVILGFLFGIDRLEVESKTIPNQGIHQSLINTMVISSPAFLLIALLIFVIQKNIQITAYSNSEVLISSLIYGLFTGILIGVAKSGTPVIKHFTLRLILYFNGNIPWNYARFLDYCTERMLLQRVGGRYRFIHKLLQDHFAQMELRRD
ncbi:hypothetical protein NIES2111_58870 (plasmid) [Nostoc sp. NIES-2111]|nr:hypothetical protein NIES2111_58870 [Nostoc sp. NIES-2111]